MRPVLHPLLRHLGSFSGILLAAVFCQADDLVTPDAIELRLKQDASYLADDKLEGRGPRTRGLELAADHIAAEFERIGLDVRSYGRSPFHEFLSYSTPVLAHRKAAIAFADGELAALEPGANFQPLALGGSGEVDAPLVFAGYGITAPDLDYDDYADLEVKDKVVVIMRHEPRQKDPASPFNGIGNSPHAYLDRKVENAVDHGAAAVLLVTDALTTDKTITDPLLPFNTKGKPEKKIVTLHVTRETIDKLLQQAKRPTLAELETAIDENLQPQSFLLGSRFQASVKVEVKKDALKNVVGVLPGAGDLAEQTLILGAHYDHLGRGGFGSLAPWTQSIHNGADDNASGTSLLLEAARQLAAPPLAANRRRIVFIAFSAEEMGLIGSERYARTPLHPLDQTIAMLNFDMVGRLTSNRLQLHGVGTAAEFDALATAAAKKQELLLAKTRSGYGPSDHASFHERGVPVLHFFTGLHRDYHRPSDDADKLNLEGMRRIMLMAVEVARDLATRPERLQAPKKDPDGLSGLGGLFNEAEEALPRGVWLGVRVAPTNEPDGLTITQVFSRSPAETAQLRQGDILLSADGDAVTTLTELQTKVKAHKAGEPLTLRMLRKGIELETEVKLQSR
ncbi:M28 family peptidase [Lignipirellula cremea]|uniref:Aminopeptidase YwaD n=1 Tax=Lignipirellula cremea TaxID=2528010 RepID=A0A518E556_9BACT|nr:M28 family peptidase [Lignipirellula cremea]QDU99220.1 Aminopeptidase YwaD precursor [Lignipirellula cremea]